MGHITVTPIPCQKNINFSISPMVAIIMGSDSDLPTMKPCAQILKDLMFH
ncbi:hypothetical protein BCR36DRAFT_443493 [Piromyces finnis]|uniref:Phosphoribosylaminoimidazole carboxylase n=1 Tax=Piromyces finnis TaxID=1754191 RepID=A0A1Y1UHH2_9FUNG|nr:hypothetical protein BCR36DRAFT_443493 [Piromyces finnis]|eukprot:ORX37482.1 hypothetical protein BCR36DRAFT_443493 [Piromyces finnis]